MIRFHTIRIGIFLKIVISVNGVTATFLIDNGLFTPLDGLFCFCCKIFGVNNIGNLGNDGICDWKHISDGLKEHEIFQKHSENATKWSHAVQLINKNKTIHKNMMKKINEEMKHWRDVSYRFIALIQYLTEHDCSFPGSSDRLYQRNSMHLCKSVFDDIRSTIYTITTDTRTWNAKWINRTYGS